VIEGDREGPLLAVVSLWPPGGGVFPLWKHAHERQCGLPDGAPGSAVASVEAHFEVQHSPSHMLCVCMLAMHLDFTLQRKSTLESC
jgi:hypothetical protein